MARKHKREHGSRKYHDFSEEKLQLAVEAVRNKQLSLRKAAERYGVPKSTINRKLNSKNMSKYGRPPALSTVEKHCLVENLQAAAKWGLPLTEFDVRLVVKKYLDMKSIVEPRFKNNMPGEEWTKLFLNRNKNEIKIRFSENVKRCRAAVSTDTIKSYFEELNVSLNGVLPDAILNYDETNMADDPGKKKVIVRRNCKHPERIIDYSKSSTSVMFAGTASGYCLPPYIVYKSEQLYHTWIEGGPKGAHYNCSRSGWFEGTIFEDWFYSTALPYLKKLGDRPKVIIGDNLASHISVKVIEECEQNNIRFVLLPPNATHLCQPLDVAFFRPLKVKWREVLEEWKAKYRGSLPKDTFPRLLKKTLEKLQDSIMQNLISGFEASGIYPINLQKVLSRIPQTSEEQMQKWNNSFEEYLKETRKAETTIRQKREKLNISPGSSVTSDFLKQHQINKLNRQEELLKKKRERTGKGGKASSSKGLQNPPKKRSDCQPSSVTGEEEEDHSSPHDSELPLVVNNRSEVQNHSVSETVAQTPDIQQQCLSVQCGDFVEVKFVYNVGSKRQINKNFIGTVLSVLADGSCECKFMRHYKGNEKVFIFPNEDDISVVSPAQIVQKLIPKAVERDKYIFE